MTSIRRHSSKLEYSFTFFDWPRLFRSYDSTTLPPRRTLSVLRHFTPLRVIARLPRFVIHSMPHHSHISLAPHITFVDQNLLVLTLKFKSSSPAQVRPCSKLNFVIINPNIVHQQVHSLLSLVYNTISQSTCNKCQETRPVGEAVDEGVNQHCLFILEEAEINLVAILSHVAAEEEVVVIHLYHVEGVVAHQLKSKSTGTLSLFRSFLVKDPTDTFPIPGMTMGPFRYPTKKLSE